MINTIIRKKDMFLQNKDLIPIQKFEKFPIYMGVTDEPLEQDEFVDMDWCISEKSGMIQLGELIPDDILYAKSHNSGIGRVWKELYESFADFLYKYLGNADKVIEIGGGNGILNATYIRRYGEMPWDIVEPSSIEPVEGCNAFYQRALWNKNFKDTEYYFDIKKENIILVHTHVLEHLLDIREFMSMTADVLPENGLMVFAIPNLRETLKRKYTNALNFEHTYMITEEYVDQILNDYQFEIIEKKLYREEHSIFYAVKKNEKLDDKRQINYKKLYEENLKLFNDYVSYHEQIVKEFNKKMNECGSPIYLFGAHIFSQYLIKFGLDTSKVKYILDNDQLKQGHRLYGTNLQVRSPEILRSEKAPIVILKVASYAEEIKKDIISNINSETIFWE